MLECAGRDQARRLNYRANIGTMIETAKGESNDSSFPCSKRFHDLPGTVRSPAGIQRRHGSMELTLIPSFQLQPPREIRQPPLNDWIRQRYTTRRVISNSTLRNRRSEFPWKRREDPI